MVKWNSTDLDPLWLMTPEEFKAKPDGTIVYSINGEQKIKGINYIDLDTRGGVLAWGLRESQLNQIIRLEKSDAIERDTEWRAGIE